MATIKLNNEQLKLIQTALDFYSRVGSLQLEEILRHPTIENYIRDRFRPEKALEVGDRTERGEIVEIVRKSSKEIKNSVNDNIKYIKTKGSWGNGEEIRKWTDIKNVKLSTDYNGVNNAKDEVEKLFNKVKTEITGEYWSNGSTLGIYNDKTDQSCRDAWDIIQVIRHEFWKENPNRSSITVDSHLNLTNSENKVEVTLDTLKDIRKEKIKKITK